jgi:hypothetical protein
VVAGKGTSEQLIFSFSALFSVRSTLARPKDKTQKLGSHFHAISSRPELRQQLGFSLVQHLVVAEVTRL